MPYEDLLKGRVSLTHQIYHITFVTYKRIKLFENFQCARIVTNKLRQSDFLNKSNTQCFVVMPDHVHWLFELREKSLSKVIEQTKSAITRELRSKGLELPKVWQKGFYDQALRKEEDVQNFARYIVSNPLRSHIVKSLRYYPHWDAIWVE